MSNDYFDGDYDCDTIEIVFHAEEDEPIFIDTKISANSSIEVYLSLEELQSILSNIEIKTTNNNLVLTAK